MRTLKTLFTAIDMKKKIILSRLLRGYVQNYCLSWQTYEHIISVCYLYYVYCCYIYFQTWYYEVYFQIHSRVNRK